MGAGTPVVLLHGLSGSTRWWSRNIEALAARHLVAAVDLVGFGRNRRFLGTPAVLPPLEETTALLARWLETFGEPVHLVGHSMGGQLAIALAAARPELVRSLLLVSATGLPFHLDPRPHVRMLPRSLRLARIARVLVPDFLRAGPASIAVAGTRVLLGDLREDLHALRVPALLVWGEDDPLVPLVYGEAMQRAIEGSRLVVLPRAAHVPMWDAPEAFNDAALAFFDEVESRLMHAPAPPRFTWGIAGFVDGIAHREAGHRRDIVLLHGLGMSSAYLGRLARELFARGWNPIAPDLPGFGESANARAMPPDEHARVLAAWSDALGIRDAVWVGHSIGCNAVARLARLRPDVVREAVCIGALWTHRPFPNARLFGLLALDALREPFALFRYVVAAYWRTGVARWLLTWLRYAPDIAAAPPRDARFLAGVRDPIPDRDAAPTTEVPGAHACVFSHADAVADALTTTA
ncbi:MAG: alpha/beta fold hydrolase [Acidobacteria bacterium]|nr:alpha/beta fold hydrolase [Acidobacteriota bacterium]MBV9476310.1 alpha/beta fold hydrolase [Acidobacteriota bacterium]